MSGPGFYRDTTPGPGLPCLYAESIIGSRQRGTGFAFGIKTKGAPGEISRRRGRPGPSHSGGANGPVAIVDLESDPEPGSETGAADWFARLDVADPSGRAEVVLRLLEIGPLNLASGEGLRAMLDGIDLGRATLEAKIGRN